MLNYYFLAKIPLRSSMTSSMRYKPSHTYLGDRPLIQSSQLDVSLSRLHPCSRLAMFLKLEAPSQENELITIGNQVSRIETHLTGAPPVMTGHTSNHAEVGIGMANTITLNKGLDVYLGFNKGKGRM